MNNNYVVSSRCSDGSILKFECHDALPSTARLAKEYAKMGYPDRYVVFSEYKKKTDSDGRYKQDTEQGIYLSCILRPSIFPSQAGLISSLAAVALTTALEEHTTKSIGIGWVSNIYCDGKLIGKVWLEGKLDNFTSYEYIIVNISIATSKENFPARLTDLIKKVFEKDNSSVEIIMAKDILNKFFSLYSNLKNPSKFMDIYRKKFILRGHKVKYTQNGKKETCKVLGVDPEDCALILERKNKEVIHVSTPNSISVPRKIQI